MKSGGNRTQGKAGIERGALLGGLLVLTFSLEFVMGVAGAPFALVGALILGAGVTLLWQHFHVTEGPVWTPPLYISAAILLSSLVLELAFRPVFAEWFAVFLALAGGYAAMAATASGRRRCNLCNRRLGGRDLTFRCPRCSQQVCEETCWNFEHRRCQLCLEQRVSMLPMEAGWWSRVAGPRLEQGRCQVCMADAKQADLRACPRCRRPECRDCWDFANGECARCQNALPDLPPALSSVVHTGLGEQI